MGERERLTEARRHNLKTRQRVLRGIRRFFDDDDFLEVETPALVPSPGLDYHLDAFSVPDSAGYLHTSPEYQMKRLLAAGLPRIYQLCKAFRRDERGHLHNPEFTMLEWYRTGAGSAEMMRDTEQLVARLAHDMQEGQQVSGVGGPIDVTPPWPRITVQAAFERYAGIDVQDVLPDEDRFFRILIEHIEPNLGKQRPTFLTHYPASMASLARVDPSDPRWADRFEAYVDGIELCNGFGELVDHDEQAKRLAEDQARRQAGKRPVYPIDERFLAALAEGIPPSGGNALGVDRLIMLLVGTRQIDDVVTFTSDEL